MSRRAITSEGGWGRGRGQRLTREEQGNMKYGECKVEQLMVVVRRGTYDTAASLAIAALGGPKLRMYLHTYVRNVRT